MNSWRTIVAELLVQESHDPDETKNKSKYFSNYGQGHDPHQKDMYYCILYIYTGYILYKPCTSVSSVP
jgi:hypothetical protein